MKNYLNRINNPSNELLEKLGINPSESTDKFLNRVFDTLINYELEVNNRYLRFSKGLNLNCLVNDSVDQYLIDRISLDNIHSTYDTIEEVRDYAGFTLYRITTKPLTDFEVFKNEDIEVLEIDNIDFY